MGVLPVRLLTVGTLAALMAFNVAAAPERRSHSAKATFQRQNPCPATGARRGACPGYVIDHVDPLCNGGADAPANMQWQTIADARTKDRDERRLCRAKRH